MILTVESNFQESPIQLTVNSLGERGIGASDLPSGIVSGSSQIDVNETQNFTTFSSSVDTRIDNLISSGGADWNTTLTNIPSGLVSGSSQIDYAGVSNIPSGIVSSSAQLEAQFDARYELQGRNIVSSSAQLQADYDARYELQGSGIFSGSSQVDVNSTQNFTSFSASVDSRIDVIVSSGSGADWEVNLTNIPAGLVSGSSQISYNGITDVPVGIVSGAAQLSGSTFEGVFVGDGSGLSGVTSYTDTDTENYINSKGVVSGSSQINHDATTGFVANEHIDHSTVSITAGNGISGGGDITSTRTITLDTGSSHFINGVSAIAPTLPDGLVSGSSQIDVNSTQNFTAFSSSVDSRILAADGADWNTNLSNIPSGIISGSSQLDGSTFNGTFVGDGTQLTGINSGSWNGQFTGDAEITGSLTVTGTNGDLLTVSQAVSTDLLQVNLSGSTVFKVDVTGSVSASSFIGDGSQLTGIVNALPTGTVSGSDQLSGSFVLKSGDTISGDLTVTGNLTVDGTTTSVNTTELNVGDNIINLNYGGSATEGGIQVRDVTGASTISGSMLWDGTNDYWKAGTLGNESKVLVANGDGVISGSSQLTTEFDSRYEQQGTGIFSGSTQIPNNSITIDQIADANIAGLDTKLLTGTPGTGSWVPRWNVDGDLADSIDWDARIEVQSSAGRAWGGQITSAGGNLVNIASGAGYIKVSGSSLNTGPSDKGAGQASTRELVTWNAISNFPLAGVGYNLIYWDASAGGFTVQLQENFYANFDFTADFTIGRIYYDGTTATIRLCGMNLWNFPRRVQMFGEEVFPVQRASGMIITETGTRNIAVSAGVLWAELVNRFETVAVDTSGVGRFTYWYRNGLGDWTAVTNQAQINNTLYDNGTGTLATLSNNAYGVHWVYVVHDSSIHVVYGQGDYSLSTANLANSPTTLPGIVGAYATLAGKIIIQKNASVFTSIESAFTQNFAGTSVGNHNDLGGLQGGATNDYFHLTSANANKVIAIASGSISGSTFTGTFIGNGSGLTNLNVDSGSWDGQFTGDANIIGSLGVTGTSTITGTTGDIFTVSGSNGSLFSVNGDVSTNLLQVNLSGSSVFTVDLTGSVSASSFIGDGSGLTNIPFDLGGTGVVSGSSQITYSGISGIPSGIVSGSSQITYSGISGIPSGIVSSSAQLTTEFDTRYLNTGGDGVISGSSQVDLTQTTNYVSGIKTRLDAEGVLSGSLPTGQGFPYEGDAVVTGSLLVAGQTGSIFQVTGDSGTLFTVENDTTASLIEADFSGSTKFSVSTTGAVSASSFIGDGSGLTGIVGGGGLGNVVEDTTPQLGGSLDLNGNNITGTGNINITGTVTATSFTGDGSGLTNLPGGGGGVSFPYSGSVEITGSVKVQPVTLGITANTASIDMNESNFFILNLAAGATTHVDFSTIVAGESITMLVAQPSGATTGSITWSPSVKFPYGSAFKATETGSAADIVSLITFNTTDVYATNIKNFK